MRTLLLRFISKIAPCKKWRHKLRNYLKMQRDVEQYKDNLKNQCEVLARVQALQRPVKVCFMVVFDSIFQGAPLYEKMLKDKRYEPYILVVPDVSRGIQHEREQREKTYSTLSGRYPGNVFKSWDEITNEYKDFSAEMDIVCSANPYDGMTHEFYRISYLFRYALPIFFNYGYPSSCISIYNAKSLFYSLNWLVFCESPYLLKELSAHMINGGSNLKLTGYIKMDDFAFVKQYPRERKKIIIAPHHTILPQDKEYFGISAFMEFADCLVSLPARYPQIDFVFRPHPLLKGKLSEVWGESRALQYFRTWEEYPNAIFQNGGSYFETFANSDGMIHDCSSFMAEYLYTEKPVCFMLKDEEIVDKFFIGNGKDMLKSSYIARCAQDIDNFMRQVILAEDDVMQKDRVDYTRKEVAYNYPHATESALNYISEALFLNRK